MKALLITLSLFISLSIKADMATGLILGSIMSDNKTTVVNNDKFSITVNNIDKQIKKRLKSKMPFLTINLRGLNPEGISNHYKNQEYNANLKNNVLYLNLSKEIEVYQKDKVMTKRTGFVFILIALGMMCGFYYSLFYKKN